MVGLLLGRVIGVGRYVREKRSPALGFEQVEC